jgi:hypothetical protein
MAHARWEASVAALLVEKRPDATKPASPRSGLSPVSPHRLVEESATTKGR